jgi:hypothetical protein
MGPLHVPQLPQLPQLLQPAASQGAPPHSLQPPIEPQGSARRQQKQSRQLQPVAPAVANTITSKIKNFFITRFSLAN